MKQSRKLQEDKYRSKSFVEIRREVKTGIIVERTGKHHK